MLDAEAVLVAGSLSKQDIETVKLTASTATGCGYCAAAHRTCPKITESTFERVKYGFTTERSYHMLWW